MALLDRHSPNHPLPGLIGLGAAGIVLLAVLGGLEGRFGVSGVPGWAPADAIPPAYRALPPVDLPPELRQRNYGGGSCMHASLITILRWQGLDDLADRWRRTYGGAASVSDLARISERLGLRYAWTTTGDERLLEWASRTRTG